MRKRFGNPFRDQHGSKWPMYVYDFVGRITEPHSVSLSVERVIPDLCVFGRGSTLKEHVWLTNERRFEEQSIVMQDYDITKQGWVNGAVWTSWGLDLARDEPCLYVAIGLYTQECLNSIDCIAGHKNYLIKQAPVLETWQLDAIKEELGEHGRLRLGIRTDYDESVLEELNINQVGQCVHL